MTVCDSPRETQSSKPTIGNTRKNKKKEKKQLDFLRHSSQALLLHAERVTSANRIWSLRAARAKSMPTIISNIKTVAYLKIDVPIFVHVECSEYVIAELFRIARWEKHFVHVNEFGWC